MMAQRCHGAFGAVANSGASGARCRLRKLLKLPSLLPQLLPSLLTKLPSLLTKLPSLLSEPKLTLPLKPPLLKLPLPLKPPLPAKAAAAGAGAQGAPSIGDPASGIRASR